MMISLSNSEPEPVPILGAEVNILPHSSLSPPAKRSRGRPRKHLVPPPLINAVPKRPTHDKSVQCDFPNCGKRFSTAFNAKRHKDQVHVEKQEVKKNQQQQEDKPSIVPVPDPSLFAHVQPLFSVTIFHDSCRHSDFALCKRY